MKLQIEVPDETWGVTVTVVVNNKQHGSCMLSRSFEPQNKVTIKWRDKKHNDLMVAEEE